MRLVLPAVLAAGSAWLAAGPGDLVRRRLRRASVPPRATVAGLPAVGVGVGVGAPLRASVGGLRGRARAPVSPRGPSGLGGTTSRPGPAWAAVLAAAWPVAAAIVGGSVLVVTGSPAAGVVAATFGAVALRGLRSAAAQRSARAGRDEVRELLRALAVELRAGAPPAVALGRCTPPLWPSIGARSTVFVDVAALLRHLSAGPGRTALRRLAALWDVAQSTGAGLADGVERLADELDEQVELRRELDAVLAGPRASARLMAVLPVGGLLLGAGLGGDPVGFVLHDPLGEGCLVVGAGLVVAGLHWTSALARAVVA